MSYDYAYGGDNIERGDRFPVENTLVMPSTESRHFDDKIIETSTP